MQALAILGLVASVMQAASSPEMANIVAGLKGLIDVFFKAKLITKEQQDALKARVDADAALVLAGVVPPAYQVRPDPQ